MYITQLERQLLQYVVDLAEKVDRDFVIQKKIKKLKQVRKQNIRTPTLTTKVARKLPFSLLVQSR